jgi:hypothetical protein
MTKTWIAVLAAALGLPGALYAAEPVGFKDLPTAEINLEPPPLDTKAPRAPTPAPPSCAPSCKPSGRCGVLSGLHLGGGCGDHAHLSKLWAWATYRPCHLTHASCCGFLLPIPEGYEYFLYPGCTEGPGGSCCRGGCGSGCGGCNGCGGK